MRLVENCGNLFVQRSAPGEAATHSALSACSACRGDYQDPDRTAWREEEREYEDDLTDVEEVATAESAKDVFERNRSHTLEDR
jgi:hypothetical protein